MRKQAFLAVLLGFSAPLAGCSHSVFIAGRTNGLAGTAKVQGSLGGAGDFRVTLGPETYTGRWVYAPTGGAVTSGSATVFSGSQSATAYGTGVTAPMGGGGSVIANSPSGASLRCRFDYSEWTGKGIGECRDAKGEIYDLQIS